MTPIIRLPTPARPAPSDPAVTPAPSQETTARIHAREEEYQTVDVSSEPHTRRPTNVDAEDSNYSSIN